MSKYKTNTGEREISSILCSDGAETLEFCADLFTEKECILSFAIKDSYLGDTYGPNHLFSRIKRAWKALTGKPIFYAEVIPNNIDDVRTWLAMCNATLINIEEEGYKVI